MSKSKQQERMIASIINGPRVKLDVLAVGKVSEAGFIPNRFKLRRWRHDGNDPVVEVRNIGIHIGALNKTIAALEQIRDVIAVAATRIPNERTNPVELEGSGANSLREEIEQFVMGVMSRYEVTQPTDSRRREAA